MENITLHDVARRVVLERGIESITRIDEFMLSKCDSFINSRINEQKSNEWLPSLTAVAIIRYRPIQRLTTDSDSAQINELFAITIITDFLNSKLKDKSSEKISGEILRQILKYLIHGNNDPYAILYLICCMNIKS